MKNDPLTEQIIGCCAIEVHKSIGPGLLESAYEACLSKELADAGLRFVTQAPVKLDYKGELIDCAFRADVIVEDEVLIELKSVADILPVHQAQLMTYLKLTKGFVDEFQFNSAKRRAAARGFVTSFSVNSVFSVVK